MIPQYLYWVWGLGAVVFLIGAGLLAAARSADRKNYIIQRATPMPLSLVNERDDVWLRGEAVSDGPVHAPHFGNSCLYYDYKLEEHVRRTRRNSKGKTETYYTWETRETSSDAAVFRLRQEDLAIEIDGGRADYKHLLSESDRVGKWRHSLSYLPCPCAISAVGSVSEKRERLETYQNIPLLVTPKEREDFIRSAERGETLLRGFGFFFLLGGMAGVFYGLWDFLGWPVGTGGTFRWETLVAGVVPAAVFYLGFWTLYIYNTLVTYRMRVDNAWHQIDVDLKMRYDLIPQLVGVAKGYFQHERGLLEKLTSLRGEALAGGAEKKISLEGEVGNALGRIQTVVEDYPDLQSQPLVERLTRELRAIEEKIAHGRMVYNEAVNEYNTNIQSFPRSLLAGGFGFKSRLFFEAAEGEKKSQRIE